MQIRSKTESVSLYEAGFFGDRGPAWASIDEYLASNYEGPVVLRYRDSGALVGGICVYDLQGDAEVLLESWRLNDAGWDPDLMWLNAQMPDQSLVVQGEYWTGDERLPEEVFFCSEEKTRMRKALRNGRHISRVAALELLQRTMDDDSWSNFLWLRETFPGHVIELSVYSKPVGLLGWNSVVWEVRSY